MNKIIIIILMVFCNFPYIVLGDASVQVYGPDGITPLDCNDDVMVGGKLTFVVSSDFNDYWCGGLFISGQDRNFGTLIGRGYDPNTRDYTDSHLQPAGQSARVFDWEDSLICGFDLYTFYRVDTNSFDNTTIPGDWFIIDYIAEQIGDCNVGFYEYFEDDSETWSEPVQVTTFSQVVTRDLDSDGSVDFNDFAVFSDEWMKTGCVEPDYCNGADLNFDSDVDCNDLQLFSKFWLWGAQQEIPSEPDEEPNPPPVSSEDPNIIYRIVDVNGNNEITIGVSESITLYVDMETNDVNVASFDIEVNISDTNLGSIDNTEYDSNDPPGPGTARILAEPTTIFIYWGPGIQQQEGIRFVAASWDGYFNDGHLASFVFTCEGAGDLTLELINWESTGLNVGLIYPTLENITIHQIEQSSQTMMSSGSTETQSAIDGGQEFTDNYVAILEEFAEQLWQDKEIRKAMSREELDEFINLIKKSFEE